MIIQNKSIIGLDSYKEFEVTFTLQSIRPPTNNYDNKMNTILSYKSYTSSIQFNDKDQLFHGKITGINDLVTFQGKTMEDVETAFIEAVHNYLAQEQQHDPAFNERRFSHDK